MSFLFDHMVDVLTSTDWSFDMYCTYNDITGDLRKDLWKRWENYQAQESHAQAPSDKLNTDHAGMM